MAVDADRQNKIQQSCTAAEDFVKVYYDSLDKSRHRLQKLYTTDACLVWNGNGVAGSEAIANFYMNLPVSETTVQCLDSQPLLETVDGQPTILVMTSGIIKYDNSNAPFHQNFVLTVQRDVWKVVTDSFRFQETL